MSIANHIKSEITVIGTGLAGMAAALFAVNRGLSTAIVGRTGEIIFASGFLDLLGVHPMEKKRIWSDPWAGIDALVADIPSHPYARVTRKDLRASLDEFLRFLEKAGLFYRRDLRPGRLFRRHRLSTGSGPSGRPLLPGLRADRDRRGRSWNPGMK